jgi:uncharacterized SAM-binding protein YcdF (DUF218 family)
VRLSFRGRPERRRRWPWRAAIALMLFGWLAGLLWFATEMPLVVPAEVPRTDAVVVLTGGTRRLATGLDLLARGDGKKLLVSGVHPDVAKAEIAGADPRVRSLQDCCVVLGYEAADTTGNAQETARWMRAERFTSLTLVTATYHMPRSLAEFRRTMPDVRIEPYPVFTDSFKREAWWRWPGSAALVLAEYHKFVAARLRFALADAIGTPLSPEPMS